MSICDEPKYTCGQTKEAITGSSKTISLRATGSRLITLTSGLLNIDIQKRTRNLNYNDWDSYSVSGYLWVAVFDLFEVLYSPCFSPGTSSFGANLSDSYKTTDTELQYLDLRYDTAVTKTIEDELTLDGDESTAPTNSVSVFTGYEAIGYHPFIFESIPIKETITYNLITNGGVTELHTEIINRAFPGTNLLMSTFPWSPWGIRIDTEWAKEIDWYRQDQRKTPDLDGNEYLFYPEWNMSCGRLSQSLDQLNAALVYQLNHGESPSGSEGAPDVITNKFFEGSVAFDKDKNIFYSLALPETIMLTDPPYLLKQNLIVDGVEQEIPIDKEADVWYPIAPL